MKLTGKCKEAFKKYLSLRFPSNINDSTWIENVYQWFVSQDDSMQHGVYVDFFHYNNMFIDLLYCYSFYSIAIRNEENKEIFYIELDTINTNEARTAVIEKANEIYNERL